MSDANKAGKGGESGGQWHTRAVMAGVFGVSVVQFDRLYAKLAPADGVRRNGKRVAYHGRRLLDAWLAHEQRKARPASAEPDPLLAGGDGDSPNLERYRLWRANREELEYRRQVAQLIPVGELEPALMRLATILRGAGDRLARLHGNEAAGVLNEAVDEWMTGVEGLLARPDEHADPGTAAADGVPDSDAPAADDAAVR